MTPGRPGHGHLDPRRGRRPVHRGRGRPPGGESHAANVTPAAELGGGPCRHRPEDERWRGSRRRLGRSRRGRAAGRQGGDPQGGGAFSAPAEVSATSPKISWPGGDDRRCRRRDGALASLQRHQLHRPVRPGDDASSSPAAEALSIPSSGTVGYAGAGSRSLPSTSGRWALVHLRLRRRDRSPRKRRHPYLLGTWRLFGRSLLRRTPPARRRRSAQTIAWIAPLNDFFDRQAEAQPEEGNRLR